MVEVLPKEYPSSTGTRQLWENNTRVPVSIYVNFGLVSGYPFTAGYPFITRVSV